MGFSVFTDLITPTKYDVPDAPFVDITAEQQETQKGNLASFKAAKQLATEFNDFMRAEMRKQLSSAVPQVSQLQAQAAKNLLAQLNGEIPEEVANQVQSRASAKALGLGIAGSPAGFAIGARDLGLTSLDLSSRATQALPSYLGGMRAATASPTYDFANVFLSPGQRIAASWQNKEAAWNVQNMKNQMDAQPEPWMKALAGLGDSVVNAAVSYYGGGAMGGMGGGGGGAGSALSSMGISKPQGWNQLSAFDQNMYAQSAWQGKMAGWGMNFE